MTQVQSGKGFEYGIAYQLREIAEAEIIENKHLQNARYYFEQCSNQEQDKIMRAAKEIIIFLAAHDSRIEQHVCKVELQSDQEGGKGDVRDIVIETPSGGIGISAKNRHLAVKHPRLSDRIDFGMKWVNHSVSQTYWDEVRPLFREMRSRKEKKQFWRDIPDKEDRFYVPLLHAFNLELQRICDKDRNNVPKNLLHYLLGYRDFYKVAKINGKVMVQSFNINGTLKWGNKLPMPTSIESRKNTTKTTTVYHFNKGWQISFRLHNAESRVIPSLKFDVQIIGLPQHLSKNEMGYLFND